MIQSNSFGGFHHSLFGDSEGGFGFGKAGRVNHLADAGRSATLLEPESASDLLLPFLPRGAGVCHDVSSDGFERIFREDTAVWIRDHLVGHDNCNAVFVCELLESSQELCQILLTRR